jgi:hypothetical protein
MEDFYFTLEATPEQVQQVLKESGNDGSAGLNEYAIIAQIDGVDKPTFQLSAVGGPDSKEVQVERPDKFHVTGRCVSLLNLSAGNR